MTQPAHGSTYFTEKIQRGMDKTGLGATASGLTITYSALYLFTFAVFRKAFVLTVKMITDLKMADFRPVSVHELSSVSVFL